MEYQQLSSVLLKVIPGAKYPYANNPLLDKNYIETHLARYNLLN